MMSVSSEISSISENDIWVFGYASLCWNPGFKYDDSFIGYIKGYSRKFWQGSIYHRGTESQPGRVATLIEKSGGVVWGKAFKISEDTKGLRYLENRECSNGGYVPMYLDVYMEDGRRVNSVTYVAHPGNHLWLGDAPLLDIACQILTCRGIAGRNVEYLLKLTEYMRRHIPQESDNELFKLEDMIRKIERIPRPNDNNVSEENVVEENNNEFASRVAESKKLKCLNI